MRPKMLTSVFVRVYQKQLGRALMRLLGTTVLSITGCPVRPDNMDNVILSATTMVYSKFRHVSCASCCVICCCCCCVANCCTLTSPSPHFRWWTQLADTLVEMREKKLPMMLVLSENDKLVDTDISYEMAAIIGAKQENVSVCNQYCRLEKTRQDDCFPWVMVLPEGGHYSFKNHAIVIDAVAEFHDAVTGDHKIAQEQIDCLSESQSAF